MASIGNMANIQFRMAEMTTRFGAQSSNLFTKNSFSASSVKSYDELWENITKDYDGYVKSEYDKLYRSVMGIKDEESAEKEVTLKQASSDVRYSADALSAFAGSLRYGDKEYDTEAAQKHIEKFVKDYNTFIEKVGDSDNNNVLQKGVIMVNTAKVYSGALGRVGIEVGSDNKLSFNKDYMSQISATDLRTTFGDMGFSEKTAQKAEQISRLSGSSGVFSYTAASTQAYSYNIGALFSTYA